MPDLPTINVPQAQADRMLAAFGNAANYRAWLRQQIVEYVIQAEGRRLDEEANASKREKLRQLRENLPADPNVQPPVEPGPA